MFMFKVFDFFPRSGERSYDFPLFPRSGERSYDSSGCLPRSGEHGYILNRAGTIK
jgi:hypothetical protein